jgi:hypothetical protein
MLAMRRIGTPETTPLRLNAPNHPACVRVRKRNNAAAPRLIVIMQENLRRSRPIPQKKRAALKSFSAGRGNVAPTIAAVLLLLFWR